MSNNFWRSNSFDQGPVVRRLISANPSLNFNPDFYVLLFNHLSRISFSILRRTFNHQIIDKKNCTDFEQPGPKVFHFNILLKIFFFLSSKLLMIVKDRIFVQKTLNAWMGRNPINVCAVMDSERLDQTNVKVIFLLFYHYYSDFIMIINITTKNRY